MKWADFKKTMGTKRADITKSTVDVGGRKKIVVFKGYVAKSDSKAGKNENIAIISTENEDRYLDIVRTDGGVFGPWEANKVVLWAHDHDIPTIARGLWLTAEDGEIKSKYEFAPTAFAQEVKVLVKGDFLKAHSIGFMPLEAEWITDPDTGEETGGIDFIKWELLEYSICNVPANRESLSAAIGKGTVKVGDVLRKSLFGGSDDMKKTKCTKCERVITEAEILAWGSDPATMQLRVEAKLCPECEAAEEKEMTKWTEENAVAWLVENEFIADDYMKADNHHEYTQAPAADYDEFTTDDAPLDFTSEDGVMFTYGVKADPDNEGETLTEIQMISFYHGEADEADEEEESDDKDDKADVTCPDCGSVFTPKDGSKKCAVCVNKDKIPDCYLCHDKSIEGTFMSTGKHWIHTKCMDKILDEGIEKAGAVLNKANKERLKVARANIKEVLDSADESDDADDDKSMYTIMSQIAKDMAAMMKDGTAQKSQLDAVQVLLTNLEHAIKSAPVAGGKEADERAVISGLVKEALDVARGKVPR